MTASAQKINIVLQQVFHKKKYYKGVSKKSKRTRLRKGQLKSDLDNHKRTFEKA